MIYRKIEILNVIAAMMIIIISITPFIKVQIAGSTLKIVMGILLVIWLIEVAISILSSGKISPMSLLTILYLILWCGFIIVNPFNIRSSAAAILLPLFPAAAFSFYGKFGVHKVIVICSLVLVFFFVLTFITTLVAFSSNPYIVRLVAHESFDIQSIYMRENVGNTYHIYVAALFVVTIVSKIRLIKQSSIMIRFFTILVLLISVYLVLTGSSGIALMACIVGIVWSILPRKNKSIRLIILILSSLLIIVGMPIVADLFLSLSNYVSNTYISLKLFDISETLMSGIASGNVSARTIGYVNDINVFLRSYLLGVGPQYTQAFSSSIVDGHSSFFGDLARFGISWGVLLVAYFRYYHKIVVSVSKRESGSENTSVYLAFMIMFIMQPVFASIEVITFMCMILPYSNLIMSMRKEGL